MLEIVRKPHTRYTQEHLLISSQSVRVCVSLLPKLISCQYCLQIQIYVHICTHAHISHCVSLSAKFKSISSLISYQFLHVVLLWPVQLLFLLLLLPCLHSLCLLCINYSKTDRQTDRQWGRLIIVPSELLHLLPFRLFAFRRALLLTLSLPYQRRNERRNEQTLHLRVGQREKL